MATAVLLLGAEPSVHPHEAIIACLTSAWQQWRFCESQVAALTLEDVADRPLRQQMGGKDGKVRDLKGEQDWHFWVRARDKARAEAARFAEMAARMGVAERQVRLAEMMGAQLGALLRGVTERIGATPEQMLRLPDAIRAELEAVAVVEVE